ncbi:MAG TPA: hypothetical protein DDW30_06935 [Clostridiales bacterium]|nr:hypothetical protein [Clostridiales bacterium]
MKGFIRRLAALAVIPLLLPCLLVACAKNPPALTFSDGAFRSKDGKLAYVEAPDTYYAIRLGDVQAVITRGELGDIPLYSVVGCDDELLADQDLKLYVAEGVALPTLDKLGAVQITLYDYTEERTYHRPMATLKETENVTDLVRLITEGEKISADAVTAEYSVRRELLFLSDPEACFGIMLEYRKFRSDVNGHGTNFVYDRDAQCYIPIGETLEQYFIGDEETETTAE